MLNLIKILVTGYLAAGKSSALEIFKKLGSYTLSADEIVHFLLKEDKILKKNIIDLLGEDVLEKSEINREKIAKKVFVYPEKLKSLEKLIHPKVFDFIYKEYEKIKTQKKYKYFVVEMPLVFDIEKIKFFDEVVLISAKEDLCKQRYKKQDFELRKQFQVSLDKCENVFVIENNSTIKSLEDKILNFINQKPREKHG
jgi:dephospho-CoA kinase